MPDNRRYVKLGNESSLECEVCGSQNRVTFWGMDGTPLCWDHMLEANAREDALAERVRQTDSREAS